VRTEPKNWDKWNEHIINHRAHWDMVHLFDMCHACGHINFISTARMENVRKETEAWLNVAGLEGKYQKLFMRGMTDYRPDYEVKLDVLNTLRSQGIEPDIAFEDKGSVVQMYRENGLRCCQVTDGAY
jgi:lipocalin